MVYSNERFHVNLAASLLESLRAHPAGLGFASATTFNASWTALGPASPRLQSPRSRAPSIHRNPDANAARGPFGLAPPCPSTGTPAVDESPEPSASQAVSRTL